MAEPLTITLTENQENELEEIRDQHAKAYVRERAAAILKIGAGQSGRQVALTGLLKVRKEGKFACYHLHDERLAMTLQALLKDLTRFDSRDGAERFLN